MLNQTLTETRPRPAPAPLDVAARAGLERFVAESQHSLRHHATRLAHRRPFDPEDLLQDSLVRITKEFARWPRDAETRLRYAFEAINLTFADALRREARRRRDGRGEVLVDIGGVEAGRDDGGGAVDAALAAAISRELAVEDDHDAIAEREVLAEAFHALNERERAVIGLSLNGHKPRDIAQALGIDPAQARQVLFEGRRVLADLILHASGEAVPPEDLEQLCALREGRLRGRDKRLAVRHLEHCAECQRLAALQERIEQAGAHVFLPPLFVIPAAAGMLEQLGHATQDARLRILDLLGRTPAAQTGAEATVATAVGGGGVLAGAGVAKLLAVACIGVGTAAGGAYCVSALVDSGSQTGKPEAPEQVVKRRPPAPKAPVAAPAQPAASEGVTAARRATRTVQTANRRAQRLATRRAARRREARRQAAAADEFGIESGAGTSPGSTAPSAPSGDGGSTGPTSPPSDVDTGEFM